LTNNLKITQMEDMLKFTYSSIKRDIVCDTDTISSLPGMLDKVGAETAMIVCGSTIFESADVVQRVQQILKKRCIGLFRGVIPHAPVETLQKGVELAKELCPEALVSVGGGSSHDTAKGLAILLAEGGDIHDHATRFTPPDTIITPDFPHRKIPIVAMPTTMGTAELSHGAGFADKALGRKVVVSDRGATPGTILIDGRALATTPLRILHSTGMGQLRIAVEAVYSKKHNPIGDALAFAAITNLLEYLPLCSADDINCLLHTKTAACMAALASASVGGLGLNTAIAHHVGGLYRVPHGEANAILLPHTMRFNLDASAERQLLIARAMGIDTTGMGPEQGGLAAAEKVAALCRTLDLPTRLRDVDVPRDGLAAIAAATMHDRGLATNPKSIDSETPILTVLREAW
jgi:alcohol dehydrogenase